MQCPFCKHEVEKGTTECPYCHYQFEVDAEVLSSDERDSFNGLTIEEDGSTSGGENTTYEEAGSFENERPERFGQREDESDRQQQVPTGFKMQTFGGYGCLIWMVIFILLMVFLFVAAVKLLFAVPILGLFVAGYFLNSMFHWF